MRHDAAPVGAADCVGVAVKSADVAAGMVFGCWTILGPACPEFRNGNRYVEAVCWSCRIGQDVMAYALVSGGSRRCKPCSLARRRAGHNPNSPELVDYRRAQARRLALIRKIAEARS